MEINNRLDKLENLKAEIVLLKEEINILKGEE
jgi:hypothetical protein